MFVIGLCSGCCNPAVLLCPGFWGSWRVLQTVRCGWHPCGHVPVSRVPQEVSWPVDYHSQGAAAFPRAGHCGEGLLCEQGGWNTQHWIRNRGGPSSHLRCPAEVWWGTSCTHHQGPLELSSHGPVQLQGIPGRVQTTETESGTGAKAQGPWGRSPKSQEETKNNRSCEGYTWKCSWPIGWRSWVSKWQQNVWTYHKISGHEEKIPWEKGISETVVWWNKGQTWGTKICINSLQWNMGDTVSSCKIPSMDYISVIVYFYIFSMDNISVAALCIFIHVNIFLERVCRVHFMIQINLIWEQLVLCFIIHVYFYAIQFCVNVFQLFHFYGSN